jgi:hypothetical protein
MALLSVTRALLLAALAATASGCFSVKQPACAFSCATDGLCPAGYSCAADGVCHRDDGQGTCDIPPQIDAGDAAADTADDGAAAQ